MELVQQYLRMHWAYYFWIADQEHTIWYIVHQGITLEPCPIYLNTYNASIRMLKEHYEEITEQAYGWQNRYPKIVRMNQLKEVEAFEMIWKGVSYEDDIVIIHCKAKWMTE